VVKELHSVGVRVSIFLDPNTNLVEPAAKCGADRIELYTEPYAAHYASDRASAVKPYIETAKAAQAAGLGINAGHDLDLQNLAYLIQEIPAIDEVSIGHALICDALYYGLENTIQMYLRQLT
jgi:pyridoxine 5-phosphate synthase